MAEILPLKAWRYNPDRFAGIDELTSPLFDVVSKEQREALYKNPFNSIHLSVPTGENPIEQARFTLQEWKSSGVILQDQLPAIYVYYQYFTLPGSNKELVRKGFICNIKAYDWAERVILRHENTIPNAVNDRIDLLRTTELNASATHGLYSDPWFELEKYMDEAISQPIYECEDYQGVRDVMSMIHDVEVIKKFIGKIRGQQIILADGHHRYEGSMMYRAECMAANPNHSGSEGYNYHMMYLTNSDSGDLRILPTHRLISGLPDINEQQLLAKLEPMFIIKPVEDPFALNEIILGKKWAFGLLIGENAYKIRLKPEVWHTMEWKFPEVVKDLDLTVMHYFIVEKVLGIPGKEQRSSEHISFNRNFAQCLSKVTKGHAQIALITKDITMEEVRNVCASGYTMPQKSTYFYPKTICGYLFGSVNESEFRLPFEFNF